MPIKNKTATKKNNVAQKEGQNDFKSVNSICFKKTKTNSPILNIPEYMKEWLKLPEIKKLKLSDKEALINYSSLKQVYDQHQKQCSLEKGCLFDGYHVEFQRDDHNILRVFTYECKYKKEFQLINNFEDNFIYRSNIAKDNLLSITEIANDEQKIKKLDPKTIKIIETLYKLFNWIKEKKELRKGFWYSADCNIGKTFNIIGLCNSLAQIGYKVIYIDNFELSSKFINFNNGNENDKWTEILKDVDVLVIDNFGMESNKSSYFYGNVLPNILESRNSKNKMTVFVSRYSRDELKKNLINKSKLETVTVNWIFGKINNLVEKRVKEIKN